MGDFKLFLILWIAGFMITLILMVVEEPWTNQFNKAGLENIEQTIIRTILTLLWPILWAGIFLDFVWCVLRITFTAIYKIIKFSFKHDKH